jgi:hypothetical protein
MAFGDVLRHVVGQALDAAHYELEDNPTHQARGLFRFRKQLAENVYAFIEFQTLYHDQSGLSRFRINLLKNSVPDARASTPEAVETTLPTVIWHEFGAHNVLPSDDHWWMYKYDQDLAYELVEAGRLLFGYGVPWMEGTV